MKVNWQSNAPSLELTVPSEVRVDGYIPTSEDLTFSGNCRYLFSDNRFNWLLQQYSNKIKFQNVTSTYAMFSNSNRLQINDLSHLEIPCTNASVDYMYQGSTIIKPAQLSGTCCNISYHFYRSNVKDIPSDYFDKIIYSGSNTQYNVSDLLFYGSAIEHHPRLEKFFSQVTSIYLSFYQWFANCYYLKEIILPLPDVLQTTNKNSNMYGWAFENCWSLSSLTFEASNKSFPWKSQVIDCSSYTGYRFSGYYPVWADRPHSYYNHDSAVETINSLPDTSAYLATAGGTNTIKFEGNAGSATEGGAINTMTPEEIAVATAKGWTVTFA